MSPGRVALLLYLTHAMAGVWLLEQPMSSVMHRHDRMRELIKHINELGRHREQKQDTSVWKTTWWMMYYGGKTPKRHVMIGNSSKMNVIKSGKLKRGRASASTTTYSYVDKHGKLRYQGTAALKDTQNLGILFEVSVAVSHGIMEGLTCVVLVGIALVTSAPHEWSNPYGTPSPHSQA